MKLDVNALRYLARDDFRTLTAVEQGERNHEVVPVPLIDAIAGLRHGSTVRCLRTLAKAKLVHHDNSRYDGYRLTPLGADYLALRALVAGGHLAAVGPQLGVGKEADVFAAAGPDGAPAALKLHRLGRTSFRAGVRAKRDYATAAGRPAHTWLHLSRLAATKEAAFMAALHAAGFAVPRCLAANRHAVLMTRVPGAPLYRAVRDAGRLAAAGRVYADAVAFVEDLAARGLVHCDLNEFNLMIDEDERLTLIDFPQMVSTSHPHARDLFDRDAAGLARFFEGKLGLEVGEGDRPRADWGRARARAAGAAGAAAAGALPAAPPPPPASTDGPALDVVLAASGFKTRHQAALEAAFAAAAADAADADEGGGARDGRSPAEAAAGAAGEGEGGDAGGASGLEDLRDRLQLGEDDDDEGGGGGSASSAGGGGGASSSGGDGRAGRGAGPPPLQPPRTPAQDRAAAVAARLKAEAARAAKAAAAARAARGARQATSRSRRRETAGGAK